MIVQLHTAQKIHLERHMGSAICWKRTHILLFNIFFCSTNCLSSRRHVLYSVFIYSFIDEVAHSNSSCCWIWGKRVSVCMCTCMCISTYVLELWSQKRISKAKRTACLQVSLLIDVSLCLALCIKLKQALLLFFIWARNPETHIISSDSVTAKNFPLVFPSKALKSIQTKELKKKKYWKLQWAHKAIFCFCESAHWKISSSLEVV